MKKEELKSKISKLIKDEKVFNSFILSCQNQVTSHEVGVDIARMFFCENTSVESDSCKACKRFNSNNIIDFIQVGDGFSAITKSEILDLISRFSLTAVEGYNKKVYIINVAENLKVDAANSLLKFLEEPPQNTFAILITKNRSEILPTIRSRCAIMVIDEQQELNQNFLIDLLFLPKNEILLSNTKLKKIDKAELLKLCEDAFKIIKLNYANNTQLAEVWLEFIDDLRFSFAKNIAIDNWLIRITEVI